MLKHPRASNKESHYHPEPKCAKKKTPIAVGQCHIGAMAVCRRQGISLLLVPPTFCGASPWPNPIISQRARVTC